MLEDKQTSNNDMLGRSTGFVPLVSESIKRDNKGHLLKGAKLCQLRKRHKGGPKKSISTLLMERIEREEPELVDILVDLAKTATDERVKRDCCSDLLAYKYGRPKSGQDIILRRGVDEVTPERLAEMTQNLELALADQGRLLSPLASVEENHALQGQEQGQELAPAAYEGEAVEAKG